MSLSAPARLSALGSALRSPTAGRVANDTWAGGLWTVVIALDLFWLSNPLLFFTFEESLSHACAVTLVASLVTPRQRGFVPPWAVVAVLAYGLLSAVWSPISTFTVKFDLTYVAVAAVGVAIAATVESRTITQGMMLGGVAYVGMSLYGWWARIPGAEVLYAPEFPAGVGTNRNIMSYTLVLSLALGVSMLPRTRTGRVAWAVGIVIIAYGIYLTQSATGFVTPVILGGAALALGWRDTRRRQGGRRVHRARGWMVIPLLVTVVAAVFVLRAVLWSSGRDSSTLSGRTPLWSATWSSLDGWQMVFGEGWGAVWQHPWLSPGPNELHIEIISRNGDVFESHGHNSFFDVLPEIGLLGAALFAAVYVLAIRQALALRRSDRAPTSDDLDTSRMALLGLLALTVYGVTEPMSTTPLGWFLLVLLATVAQVHSSGPSDESVDQA
jgi:O-antigen ligase